MCVFVDLGFIFVMLIEDINIQIYFFILLYVLILYFVFKKNNQSGKGFRF